MPDEVVMYAPTTTSTTTNYYYYYLPSKAHMPLLPSRGLSLSPNSSSCRPGIGPPEVLPAGDWPLQRAADRLGLIDLLLLVLWGVTAAAPRRELMRFARHMAARSGNR